MNSTELVAKEWKKAKLLERYSGIQEDSLKDLEHGLWILKIAKERLNDPYLTAQQIHHLLSDVFGIPSDPIGITRAFAKAGGSSRNKKQVIKRFENANILYKIALPGEKYLDSISSRGLLSILYFKPDSHRVSKKKLTDLVKSLKAKQLKICDPYYGERTLDVLEESVRAHKKALFLSHMTNENQSKFKREFAYLKKQYPNKVEMRIFPKKELHDRYILCENSFLLMGQGIKDIGNKESLVLLIDDRFGKEIRKELEKTFDSRWNDPTTRIL